MFALVFTPQGIAIQVELVDPFLVLGRILDFFGVFLFQQEIKHELTEHEVVHHRSVEIEAPIQHEKIPPLRVIALRLLVIRVILL